MDMTAGSDKPYWVAFNHVKGIGAVRTGMLLKRFGNLRDAWNASLSDLVYAGISEKLAESIIAFRKNTVPEALTESRSASH